MCTYSRDFESNILGNFLNELKAKRKTCFAILSMIANRAEMTLAVAVLLFAFGLWPYYVTARPLIPSSQDEGQTESDLTVVMNGTTMS